MNNKLFLNGFSRQEAQGGPGNQGPKPLTLILNLTLLTPKPHIPWVLGTHICGLWELIFFGLWELASGRPLKCALAWGGGLASGRALRCALAWGGARAWGSQASARLGTRALGGGGVRNKKNGLQGPSCRPGSFLIRPFKGPIRPLRAL